MNGDHKYEGRGALRQSDFNSTENARKHRKQALGNKLRMIGKKMRTIGNKIKMVWKQNENTRRQATR